MTTAPVQLRKRMRQSLVGSADICLARAKFDMDPGKPRTTGEARCIGTAYHAGQEFFYRGRQLDPEMPVPERGTEDWQWLLDWAHSVYTGEAYLDPNVAEWLNPGWDAVVDMLDVYFHEGHTWPSDFQVVGVEASFTTEWLPDWDAHGTLDLVLRDPAGYTILVDHKTAGRAWDKHKHMPRKNTQACWYAHWWRELHGAPTPRFVFDVITRKGAFERRVVQPTDDQMRATLKRAELYAGLLGSGAELPGNPSATLCSPVWCDHFSTCEWGQVIDG